MPGWPLLGRLCFGAAWLVSVMRGGSPFGLFGLGLRVFLLLPRCVSVIGLGSPGFCGPLLRSCSASPVSAFWSGSGFASAVGPGWLAGVSSCDAALPSCSRILSLSVFLPLGFRFSYRLGFGTVQGFTPHVLDFSALFAFRRLWLS